MRNRIMTVALAALLTAGVSSADDFIIEAGEEGNSVTFISTAPMESFKGETDQVSGEFSVDLGDLHAGAQVEVRVDLESLDTGIMLRNKHMCSNHLETDKYPEAVFRADRLLKAPSSPLTPESDAEFLLAGSLTLHGVTREINAPVHVSCSETGGLIRLDVSTEFEITLSDYDIKRPKFLVLKLNETQKVKIRLTAREVLG